MVLQNYQNFTEMTSNTIHIVAFGVGLKCPRKIHLIPVRVGYDGKCTVNKNEPRISLPEMLLGGSGS